MKYLFVLFFMFFATLSYSEQKDIEIKLSPDKIEEQKPSNDTYTITSKTSGKQWSFSSKEILQIYKNVHNWNIVESTDPVIKKVYEDSNYLYIVFGYIANEDKEFLGIKLSKKDKSVLSGKILIHKKYLINEKMKECDVTFWKGATVGAVVYSVVITIALFILIL